MIKEITILEAKNKIKKLENELNLYLTKKKLNYQKTQPQSIKIKDIVTHTNSIFDKFSHYVIKDEELDSTIYLLQEEIVSYQEYIIKEMKRISEVDPVKLKVYLLREDEEFISKHGRKRTWFEIIELTNYSERQVKRMYSEVLHGEC